MSKSQDLKQNVSEEEKVKIMKQIEVKTEKILVTAINTGKIANPIKAITQNMSQQEAEGSMNILQGIMSSGAEEFEKKVGRPMTYSEMRSMFG